MAKNQAIRIRPTALQADLNACTALQSLSGYKPSNPAYATTAATDKLERDASRARGGGQRAERARFRPRQCRRRRMGFSQHHAGRQGSGGGAIRKRLQRTPIHGLEESVRAQSAQAESEESRGVVPPPPTLSATSPKYLRYLGEDKGGGRISICPQDDPRQKDTITPTDCVRTLRLRKRNYGYICAAIN